MGYRLVSLLAIAGLSVAALAVPPQKAVAPLGYNRDIRPILSDNCFACHGPDKNKRQASLRLDQPGRAVVPGDILASPLAQRVLRPDGDPLQMPPGASHKALTPAQRRTLLRWIAEGGRYEAHWSFTPLRAPAIPKVAGATNPVDGFIRARLAKEGIRSSPEADRRTLLRRLSLDLIGLPPTPEEVAAFLADKRPGAYERQVERLLASPHFGERLAVPWLDSVRYADTVGYHGDQNRNAWAYRDWVIDAFNANMPFDRFTREQLAGDLLPNPTLAQRTATCFNRLNMVTREGGAQPNEYLHKYMADRVRTVGMAWLGITTGCAECHDHKYDPFSQRDFYSLAAFFGDMKQWGVYADYGYTPNPDLRGVGNDHPFPPEITVESRYLKERIARLQREWTALAQSLTIPTAWQESTRTFLAAHSDGWESPAEGTVVLTEPKATTRTVTLAPRYRSIAAVRLEVLPRLENNGSLFRKGVRSETVNLTLAVSPAKGKPRPVPIRYASADVAEPRYQNSFALLGVHRGWRLSEAMDKTVHHAVYTLSQPVTLAEGETLAVTLPDCDLGCIRLSVSPLAPADPDAAALAPELSPRSYLMATAADPERFAQAVRLERELTTLRQGKTPVMVTETTAQPLTLRVLPRGNWQDETGAVTPPAYPHFLPGGGAQSGKRLTRLDLANWLTSKENPIVARVFVNRLWKHFFGTGLAATIEDLGAQGEAPSHPELLDWLAASFRSDWNIKRLVRLLVTSQTYRQVSTARPDLKERDPQNRLLAAQNPRRLEAEFVRDNALTIAGLLNPTLGGPPCKPYQPAGYYAPLQFPDRDYDADTTDSQWRRGVYMHWQRTFLHPMLANFDAPNRDEPGCTRTLANTPQQALTLLNDPTFVEAARVLAERLPMGTPAQRLDALYQRSLARSPKPAEQRSLLAFYEKVRAAYRERPDDAKALLTIGQAPRSQPADPIEQAAWVSVCRVVLNLHETITRY